MICSKCKHQIAVDPLDNIKHCPKCGNPIDYNRCSGGCKSKVFETEHDIILEDGDLYCKYCGAKSTYNIQGIFEEN